MKTLLFFLCLVAVAAAETVNITLVWDEYDAADLVGYRVYWGAAHEQYTEAYATPGKEAKAVIALEKSRYSYIVVVAHFTDHTDSQFSAEFVYYAKAPGEIRLRPPVTGVEAPKELNSARIEKSTDLKNWVPIYFTTDPKAFFRLVVSAAVSAR